MVLPLIIGGVMAVSAIAQWMNSEQARNASAQELAYMRDLWSKMQAPNFDYSQITPEEFQVVAQYVPQTAKFIQEKDPTIIQRTQEYDMGRSAQMQALARYMDISKTGADPRFQAAQDQAWKRGQMESNSAMRGIEQRANERGTLGSGVQMMLQSQAAQSEADRAADVSANAAGQMYEGQLSALDKGANIGRNVEQSEFDRESRNAGIINDFNQRLAARGQEQENMNVGIMNDAARRNLGERQRVADANTTQRTAAKYDARDNTNKLKQQDFNNQADIIAGKTGVSNQTRNDITQNTQDRNQQIQGVANAGGNWMMYEQSRQDSGAAETRADDRAYFNKYGVWPNEDPNRRMKRTPYAGGDSGSGGTSNIA